MPTSVLPQDPLFSFSAIAQIVLDPLTNQLVGVNQEACRLLGKDRAEALLLKASELFSKSFPDLIVFTQALLEQGRGWRDDLWVQTAQGAERIEIMGRSATAGEHNHLYLSLQRVEELDNYRKQSDARRHYLSGIDHWSRVSRIFQEFEFQNKLLLDAAGEGIYGVDANGTTTFVNPAAEKILGYSTEELAGKNMHNTVHHSHADGSHFGAEQCPIFAAFREGVVHRVNDDIFWSKTGKPIAVEYTSTPIRENDFIVGAVVVFHDVSEKKAYERQLLEALSEVEHLKNRLEMEKAYLQEEIKLEFNQHQIIGSSPAFQQVLQQIELVGPTDATVLISGESGTGKELIARAIHETSNRSERPLIRVNCAAVPADLFESEFFGHIKGAFTGASDDRPGRFELADGGTLFLDEVGEIPLHLQGKLLRVLQEQQFERIGESKTRNVDVRIIAATNRDLRGDVENNSFREDLFFRLNVFPIESVPLRKRKEDIPLLTQHFLQKASTRANKQGLKIPISEMSKLQDYNWPGNVRELENIIERQVILSQGDIIRFDGIIKATGGEQAANAGANMPQTIFTEQELRQQERRNILLALKRTKGKIFGNQGAAALLEIKPTTLASRIKKYQIDTASF